MNKLEKYLEKQNKIISDDRDKTLIALGLTEKEYCTNEKDAWKYPNTDYINGEKLHYKEVPIKVTDEEYELIIEKAKEVEAIKLKEEKARQDKQDKENRLKRNIVKKWIPIFEKPKSVWESPDCEKNDTGSSKIALVLRIFAWVIGLSSLLAGFILSILLSMSWILIVSIVATVLQMLLFYALSAILDYLAELTSIARRGHKYSETNE